MAKKQTVSKVKVSERALFARLSRAMVKDGLVLRRGREDSRWFSDTGYYYSVDLNTNVIDGAHLSLEDAAREFGVLRDYEELAAE